MGQSNKVITISARVNVSVEVEVEQFGGSEQGTVVAVLGVGLPCIDDVMNALEADESFSQLDVFENEDSTEWEEA